MMSIIVMVPVHTSTIYVPEEYCLNYLNALRRCLPIGSMMQAWFPGQWYYRITEADV